MGYYLMKRFVGCFPSWKAMAEMCKGWNAPHKLLTHCTLWLIFKFKTKEIRDRVLQGGPYIAYGCLLYLKLMPQCFDFQLEAQTKCHCGCKCMAYQWIAEQPWDSTSQCHVQALCCSQIDSQEHGKELDLHKSQQKWMSPNSCHDTSQLHYQMARIQR